MATKTSAPRSTYKRTLLALLLVLPCASAAFIAGCGDDDDNTVTPGNDSGSPDTSTPDTSRPPIDGGDAGNNAAQIARGKYLVDHVAACGDCHTPRLPTGAPDMAKYLAGTDCFVDVNGPDAGGGCLNSANLTNHETGLKSRTDAEIKKMMLDGVRPDGKNLVPVMPYFSLHNMKPEDANAIVAYLRTVAPVDHRVAANDPPFNNVPAPAAPIDPATIPPATGASAENGRYLAAMVGPCLECHTPELPPGSLRPSDMTRPFAGGRSFTLPPPFGKVYASNLTSHATGLAGWTAADVQKVLKQGKDRTGGGVCPPMPSGPMGAFGGLTDQDALDIANYIVGLPPVDNAIPGGNGSCVGP